MSSIGGKARYRHPVQERKMNSTVRYRFLLKNIFW